MSATSRLLTTASVVFGSSTAGTRELTGADRVLRMPLPLARRFGIVHVRGGVGASGVAAGVASLVASRRSGNVLGVNASAGPRHVLAQAGLPLDARPTPSPARASARSGAEAVDGLPRTASGLWALDLVDPAARGVAASGDTWFRELAPISRFFDVIVTDFGLRDPRVDLAEAVAASHAVCLVARTDRHSAEEVASLVEAVRAQEDRPGVVVALVDVLPGGRRTAELVAAHVRAPVIRIPHDAARAGADAVPSAALSTRTRIAHTRVAAALMLQSQRPTRRAGERRRGERRALRDQAAQERAVRS